ncbi:MAG: hypothetical protein K0U84_13545 [Actinomycetia bacterium]|nr:hypothetical protein [Actinomycetes bacterium]
MATDWDFCRVCGDDVECDDPGDPDVVGLPGDGVLVARLAQDEEGVDSLLFCSSCWEKLDKIMVECLPPSEKAQQRQAFAVTGTTTERLN